MCQDQMLIYMAFVDLKKAFDTFSREGLGYVMAMSCCLEEFIGIVRKLHDGMMTSVSDQLLRSVPNPIQAQNHGRGSHCSSFGFDLKSWEPLDQDRPAWRRKVQEGAVSIWHTELSATHVLESTIV